MVDTPKSITDLLTTVFQDGQAANSISENDLRDLIVSLRDCFGGFHLSTPATTTISSAGTYYTMNGTTVFDSSNANLFDQPVNNRLRYIGTVTRKFVVAVTCSIDVVTGSNQEIGMKVAKNGVVIDDSEMHVVLSASGDGKLISVHHIVELATSDYLSIYFTNATAGNGVIVDHADMHAMSVFY